MSMGRGHATISRLMSSGINLASIDRLARRGAASVHTGNLVFFPAGVPTVKIAFARVGDKVTQLTVADPERSWSLRNAPQAV